MGIIIIFILIFLVSQGFLFLEEEVLILFAAIFWVDCAGGVIKEGLWSELEHRRFIVRDKFKWYLNKKITLLEELIKKHQSREQLVENVSIVYESYISKLIENLNIITDYSKISRYKIEEDINQLGLYTVYLSMLENWVRVLSYYLYKKMDLVDKGVKKEWLGE